jgi:Mn-dependent DtxR family transcriptional regulator
MFAAWFEIHDDDTIVDSPTALRVYARLLRNPLIFTEPQDVKAWVLAGEMKVHPTSVQAAIQLLVDRGYVIDHGRGVHNVRRLTIAIARAPLQPA